MLLLAEAEALKEEWPPLKVGLFRGLYDRFEQIADKYQSIASKSSMDFWNNTVDDEVWNMYKQGDILLIPFPYSDLSATKQRPVFISNRK